MRTILLLLVSCLPLGAATTFYQTTFSGGNENPISEGSKWSGGLQTSLDWQNCKILSGAAQAAVGSGSVNDDDATAICTGFTWGNDQIVTYTVGANPTDGEESEIRLRSALSAHSNTGYEINWQSGNYIQFVAWNGALNNFTMIKDYRTSIPVRHTGDVFYGKIVGTTLSAYVNGTLITTATDSTFSSGKPGFGFFGTTIGQTMTSWGATDGTDPQITAQPQSTSGNVDDSVTFTVVAQGLSTLSYQWQFTGTNVGANSSSYTRVVNQADSGGAVTVVVTDSMGNVTSSSATLTVTTTSPDPVPADRLPYGGTWEGIVGVVGGIPNNTTVSATLDPGSTMVQINSAIAACPTNQVVQLTSGVFTNLGNTQMTIAKSGVTVRGATNANGLPDTTLIFAANRFIDVAANTSWDSDTPSQYTNINISSGPTRGSYSVVLASTPGNLTVGMLMWITASNNIPTIDGGGWTDWFTSTIHHPFSQVVEVTNVSGTTVSFTPAINADYLAGSLQAAHYRVAAALINRSGMENIYCTNTSGSFGNGAYVWHFQGANQCWLKNCKAYGLDTPGSLNAFVYFQLSKNCEMRHCDLSHFTTLSSSTYEMASLHCSGLLIEDNIFHDMPNVWPILATSGSAFAYNIVTNEPYATPTFLSQIVFFHGSHSHYNLFEGNWNPTHFNDLTASGNDAHSRNNIYFRQRMLGWDGNGPKDSNVNCITLQNHHDNVVIVGNVMGHTGTQTTYDSTSGGVGGANIFNADLFSRSSMLRLGNYNTVNSAIPAGESISGKTLVTSYLHSSKPSWFASLPWPWVDSSNYNQSNDSTNFPAGYRFAFGQDPGTGQSVVSSMSLGNANSQLRVTNGRLILSQ